MLNKGVYADDLRWNESTPTNCDLLSTNEIPRKQKRRRLSLDPEYKPRGSNKISPEGRTAPLENSEPGESAKQSCNGNTANQAPQKYTASATSRGPKRRRRRPRLTMRRRTKSSSTLAKAKAAVKKAVKVVHHKQFVRTLDADGAREREKRKRKARKRILRRIASKRIGKYDTVVNLSLCKIKLEEDYVTVKTEPGEEDAYFNDGNNYGNDDLRLMDHLNENLGNGCI